MHLPLRKPTRGNSGGCEIGYNTVAMSHLFRAARDCRRLSPVGALTAALFLAYFVALPPHLAHHIADQDHSRPACPHLAQSQHTPAVQCDSPTLAPPIPTETGQAMLPGAPLASSEAALSSPRAPPKGRTFRLVLQPLSATELSGNPDSGGAHPFGGRFRGRSGSSWQAPSPFATWTDRTIRLAMAQCA